MTFGVSSSVLARGVTVGLVGRVVRFACRRDAHARGLDAKGAAQARMARMTTVGSAETFEPPEKSSSVPTELLQSNTSQPHQSARRGVMSAASGQNPVGWSIKSHVLVFSMVCAAVVVFSAAWIGVDRPTDAVVVEKQTPIMRPVDSRPALRSKQSTSAPPPPDTPQDTPHFTVPLITNQRVLLESLDPGLFKALPPTAGHWVDSTSPCFVETSTKKRKCLPNYLVIGAWQSGGQAFNMKLSKHADINPGINPHFWNEDKPVTEYLNQITNEIERSQEAEDASNESENTNPKNQKIIGDASPGVLANTWTESQRIHREFKEYVARCWQECQKHSDTIDDTIENNSPQTPRRKCIDGDVSKNYNDGCMAKASKLDPLLNEATSSSSVTLSIPHLMRAAYGNQSVKIIAVVRSPLARLRTAFHHYPHYGKEFGTGESGFDKFIETFVEEFERCEGKGPDRERNTATDERRKDYDQPITTRTRSQCAYYFESHGPVQEKVFYHCDQLIKTMYGTFLKNWASAFGRENILVLRTEEVFSDKESIRKKKLLKTAEFLGLRKPTAEELIKMDSTEGFKGDDYALAVMREFGDNISLASTSKKTIELVDAFFAPEMQLLSDLFPDAEYETPWAELGRGLESR